MTILVKCWRAIICFLKYFRLTWPVMEEIMCILIDFSLIRERESYWQALWDDARLVFYFVLTECNDTFIDFSVQFFFINGFKRKLTRQHDEQKNSARPYIGRWTPILLFADNFGAHIARCTAEDAKFITGYASKSEVNQFNLLCFWVVHDVFRLQISVRDVFFVHVSQGIEHLTEDTSDHRVRHQAFMDI